MNEGITRLYWAPVSYIEKHHRALVGHTLLLIDDRGDTVTGEFRLDCFSIYVGHYRVGDNMNDYAKVDNYLCNFIAVKDYSDNLPADMLAEHRGFVAHDDDTHKWRYQNLP